MNTVTPQHILDVNGNIGTQHLVGRTSLPAATGGAGAGSGSTLTITGTDLNGYITLLTPNTPSTSSIIFTVTFNVPYVATPRMVLISPASAITAQYIASAYISDISTTSFSVSSGSAVPLVGASNTYAWYYCVIQ